MEDDFVGAIKIKDGLFIGDEYAAQDFEFVVTNKVTHIINCAGKQIPNYWETVGVIYLTFDWLDSENQIVFDTKGEVVNEIFNFIEEAAKLGEGVLVHSIKGQSRSCCVLTAYFMKRYHWSLYKTLEFLTSRRSDLEIRTSFYHQLLNLESRLFQQSDGNVTVNWFEMGPENDKEEILLRNTFLNARSAPFDEALVNPQAGVDTRPRTINWGDERPSSKGGLSAYLTKESVAAARLSKAPMVSCTSILKGSNKVFKLKVKEEEVVASSSTKGNGSGLRANKSVRNFSEGRNSDAMVDDANTKAIMEKSGNAGEKNSEGKGGKGPNMMRSSSAIYLDKEENHTRSASTGKGQSNDKSNNGKVSNVNGNIIHLTVNNYIAPGNNQSNKAQTNNNFAVDNESKPRSGAPKTPEPRPASQQKALENKKEEEPNKQAEPVIAATSSGSTSTKGSVSTNYLKSAIEKKLSKEYKSQLSSTAIKGDIQPVTVKTPSGTESKGAKAFKEYAKPSDLKVNYQVLLKNRETPPPRKREEAKRGLDSPNKKAASKSSISTKGTNDSSMPYSSYLNSMFSTSFSQLNTVTPSAYATTGEKKTPISAKAAMSYNLTLSQKAQTLTRPQRSNAGQIGDKNYGSSVLGSTLSKSKLEPSSATLVGAKYNNYTSTAHTKGNPVRVTYEKIERPHSATPDRSATPQAGARRPGTSSGAGFGSKGDRFSVPSKSPAKHGKKDSGTTQELLAKHRQRSSSPSPMSYNPALSNSNLSLKSKAKY